MDIFWDLFNESVADPIAEENKLEDTTGSVDQTEDKQGTDAETINTEDKVEDSTTDKEIIPDNPDENKDTDDLEPTNKEGEKWEGQEVIEDLVEKVEDKIDKVENGNADAVEMLKDTLSDLQEANFRIKELEEDNKQYQDKYFDKYSETSEMSLMKPLVETVKSDPELFLLVKSFKKWDSTEKLDNLIKLVEKESWIDVSKYLLDNWKSAVSSVTWSWSNSWTAAPRSNDWFIPENNNNNSDELF